MIVSENESVKVAVFMLRSKNCSTGDVESAVYDETCKAVSPLTRATTGSLNISATSVEVQVTNVLPVPVAIVNLFRAFKSTNPI